MSRARANRIVPIFNLAACLLFLYVLLPVIRDSGLRLFPEASSDAVTGLNRLVLIPPGRAIRHSPPDAIAGHQSSGASVWLEASGPASKMGWALDFCIRAAAPELFPFRQYLAAVFCRLGIAALIILILMALTSHRRAMKLLGRNWKRLHRLVYFAAILVVLHSINGMLFWEQIPGFDVAFLETQTYGLQIALLLLLRLARVRRLVERLLRMPKQKRGKAKMKA